MVVSISSHKGAANWRIAAGVRHKQIKVGKRNIRGCAIFFSTCSGSFFSVHALTNQRQYPKYTWSRLALSFDEC
jgi:hypothetical protein